MSEQILLTKLYVPSPRPDLVPRHRLIERLNKSLVPGCKLTLISAPAGFGKTTLVCDWLGSMSIPSAWLTLDERDKDPAHFLAYFIAAMQNVKPGIGLNLQAILQIPQPLQIEYILTLLINEISMIEEDFVIVMDDYHRIDSLQVDQSLGFLVEHQPAKMHLVITTREDPDLPLARLRGRGQCIEIRAADLRFTNDETAEFLNRIMKLGLSEQDINALETRTEGWIAGLQMAALSLDGLQDTESFIKSFTGSHRFVMDYLVEEVLKRQPENIQAFLLRTSILERLCGPLCDAIILDHSASGQETLEYLEHANMFIIPLDNERRWYRYHHLFSDLLRQRLGQSLTPEEAAVLHIHASEWYESNGLILEAFKHAALANDFERAERLMESKQMPLHQRGAAREILSWLESLPTALLNTKPSLWWKQASLMLVMGQTIGVEERLQATEAALAATALSQAKPDDSALNLIGKIAVARATLAQVQGLIEPMLIQSRRALEYLHPDNLTYRSSAARILGFAYFFQGDRAAACKAYAEALSLAEAAGDITNSLLALIRLGQMQALANQFHQADQTFQRVLLQIDEYSPPNSPVVYHSLAWIHYEWNDLDTAEKYGQLGLQMAQRYSQVIDRVILCGLFLAYLRLARGDVAGSKRYVAEAEQALRQKDHNLRMPDIATARASILLYEGNTDAALQIAQQYDLPLLLARVHIARGNPSAALGVLAPYRQKTEAGGLDDERLRALTLQALAFHLHGDKESARQALAEALTLGEPGGFIRLFVDRGEPMRCLILEYKALAGKQSSERTHPQRGYLEKILTAFQSSRGIDEPKTNHESSGLIEPLSQRELDILQLIAQGISNREIGARLFLALDTIKGYNRKIFEKLQVHSRTQAIARARELGLL